MSVNSTLTARNALRERRKGNHASVDVVLLVCVLITMALGLVMVTSASITTSEKAYGDAFYYLYRQGGFLIVGMCLAAIVWRTPISVWQIIGPAAMVATLILLTLVLVPGIGKSVNGSYRWLYIGGIGFQVSELAKLMVIVYMAGYLTRHAERVATRVRGFLMPMLVLALVSGLLLSEPDFGATAVITATTLFMLFLARVRLWSFALLFAVLSAGLALLVYKSPYRLQRLTSFQDPWADPFNTGFQLSQSLIAFGRGEGFGVGLGSSVQKLFYLPEAHTDFIVAVIAEELGAFGVISVIALFAVMAWRAMVIARRAMEKENVFGAYIAYGVGFWLVLQAYINIGVNMGALPTKGITLPLISYGGSSIIISCIAIAMLLRVDLETRFSGRKPGEERRKGW